MKILIVDDSDITMKMIESTVQRFGFYSLNAVNGKDALQKIKQNTPNLIIYNSTPTNMNCYQFLKLLNNNNEYKNIPIIMINETILDNIYHYTILEQLTRPFTPIELQIRLNRVFEMIKA